MEQMIDKHLIKKLRGERAWPRDQLATISGLSLRTIHRIESEGACSLESKRALAAALDVGASDLEMHTSAVGAMASTDRGRNYGFAGAAVGLIGAYIGITLSFISGHITSGEAGIYYGGIGAFCGICCAITGAISSKSLELHLRNKP